MSCLFSVSIANWGDCSSYCFLLCPQSTKIVATSLLDAADNKELSEGLKVF